MRYTLDFWAKREEEEESRYTDYTEKCQVETERKQEPQDGKELMPCDRM